MSTLAKRLRSSAASLVRLALGAAMGLGLTAALVAGPVNAQTPAAPSAAAQSQVVQAQGAGPALWVVSDADSTLYLFGTVHVLRPTTPWGSAKVDAAFASASDVWFEISNPDDQAAIMPLVQQYGLSPTRPLTHLVSTGELTLLDNAARGVGLTALQMEPFRPWLAALTLSVAPLTAAGYDPTSGVELVLKSRAQAGGKTIHGFETIDKQVGILAGLSEPTQLAFLSATLTEFENAATQLDELVNAWATGDVEAIDRTAVREMRSQSQEVYDALLVRRNADWANQIQTLLAGSGTAFIAVGAAHLAGDDSVQFMLEDRGVAVVRQ